MVLRLLALFGFAPRDAQAGRPPLFAYLTLLAAAYFAAYLVDWAAALLGHYGVYLRTVGVASSILVAHALYRAVVHQDDHSMGAYIRRQLIG